MGTATLGFAGGRPIAFRIDPDNIAWNFEVLTNVTETIGGRVIQVIGSYLDDLTVQGSFGQDHSTPHGESWRQAEAFLTLIQAIMDQQAADANQQAMMHPPCTFSYPPKNWRFQCYVKDFSDADSPGSSIVLTPGRFNQRWQLRLFIVQDSSTRLVQAGESGGVISQQAQAAVEAYMARISDGVGWHFTQYTGVAGQADQAKDEAAALKLYPQLKTTAYYAPPVAVGGIGAAAGGGAATVPVNIQGLANPIGQGAVGSRIDMGVDFTGTFDLYALGPGTITCTQNGGWPGGTFICIKLDNPAGRYIYYAENIQPLVQVGQKVTAGQKIGHAPGGSPWTEIGWAAPPGTGSTMAAQAGQASLGQSQGDPGKYSTGYGVSMNNLLKSLGAPSGSFNGPQQGTAG